jgi:hypothetical protein
VLPRPAFDQNYVVAMQRCGELWEPVELVRLVDIMHEEAKNTAERGAIIDGVIEGRYRIEQDNKSLRLDDYVNKNCYGGSRWHTNAYDIWSLPRCDRKAAQSDALLAIRNRIFLVVHPWRSTGAVSYKANGIVCATRLDFYGGMGVAVVNVLGHLDRLTPMANHFASFGVTHAFSSPSIKGHNMLPNMSGLNVVRHFIIDMLDPSGPYRTVYWVESTASDQAIAVDCRAPGFHRTHSLPPANCWRS